MADRLISAAGLRGPAAFHPDYPERTHGFAPSAQPIRAIRLTREPGFFAK